MSKDSKNVFVGLSGGVDSSVSALLLKEQGYNVTGVFIRGWQPDWIPCTWKTDRISAIRTAAYLDIPFITLNLENEYKDKVVAYLLDEYKKGNTPNPDMLCNREIKFGDFLKWSIKNGADFVATGHYSVVSHPFEGGVRGGYEMLESNDKEKNQSYFLSQLTQKELSKIFFPIGHLQKSEVRKIAKKNNLPVATRKDSQGICFVGDLEMSEFLKRELKPEKGNVINDQGEIIGTHEGAILYTIGQRHGFKINNFSAEQKHFYVIRKNLDKNTITVSVKTPPNPLLRQEGGHSQRINLVIRNFSFTNNLEDIQNAKKLSMRIRYRGEKIKINFINYNEQKKILEVSCDEKIEFAHGQFAVLYDEEKCLGGGEL